MSISAARGISRAAFYYLHTASSPRPASPKQRRGEQAAGYSRADNKFPKRIGALILVAAPHNRSGEIGDFVLPGLLEGVSRQAPRTYLFHSKDDQVVHFAESGAYKKQLPGAELMVFEDRGHFNQLEFPEIEALIKSL